MATAISKTIDVGGSGDYASLYAAEVANFGSATGNLVTGDEIITNYWICTNGAADSTAVVTGGQTTDATHTIEVIVPVAYRHSGKWPASGNFARYARTGQGIRVGTDNITFTGVAARTVANAHGQYALGTNSSGVGDDITFQNCYCEMVAGAYVGHKVIGLRTQTAGHYTWCINCIGVIDAASGSDIYKVSSGNNGDVQILACTGVKGAYNFNKGSGGTATIINCLSFGAGTTDSTGTWENTSINNGYSAAAPTGASASIDVGATAAAIFVDYANNDLTLVAGCAACGVGTQLYDAATPVTTDIRGAARPKRGIALPDIGAFQVTAIPSPSGLGGGGAMVDLRFREQRPAPYWSSRRRRR